MTNPFEQPLHRQNFTEYLREEVGLLPWGGIKFVEAHGRDRSVFYNALNNTFAERKFRVRQGESNTGWWVKRVK